MCGIIGYAGGRPCKPLLLAGLERLEYRGYDSAGLALVDGGDQHVVRAVGNLAQLRAVADPISSPATTGIGHTRWATHGRPAERNAHPLRSPDGRFAVVLNGIIENYLELKERLAAQGAEFSSETDAETVAHLVQRALRRRPGRRRAAHVRASSRATSRSASSRPTTRALIVGARRQCPLVIGLGDGETFVASDIVAFLSETRRVRYIEDGELVAITPAGAQLLDPDGGEIARDEVLVTWDDEAAEKGGYETFMLKEICEQPRAIADTIGERLHGPQVRLDDMGFSDEDLLAIDRVAITACGTARHAGLVGRYLIEEWARLPVEIDVASEFRYRYPVVDERTLVIAVSQSGETADTIAAQRVAREGGARTLAVCNVMGTQLTREADGTLYTRAGREIGVAATKTFTSQVVAFTLLALKLAELRGALPPERIAGYRAEIEALPRLMAGYLAEDAPIWAARRGRRVRLVGQGVLPLHRPRISAWRAASRARSSSRRSPTSRPTATPRGR